jgi:hypothetical protein
MIQAFLLERMLKFFLICAGVVFCSLTTMIGILIVVWGDQIQFADYVPSYTYPKPEI